ncbi:MAG TPA: shikimate dehydrogenase [Blastocatellia bacterium]|nr:shikimate dehydrogenase [Blastocatellia bacterium]
MPGNPSRVCAVVAEQTVGAAREAMRRAAKIADLAELRLDYLRDFDFTNLDALRALLEQKPLPTIITCRAAAEGGKQQVEDRVRLRLLVEGARRFADYCDIEAAHYAEAAALTPDLSRLIVSYHNFVETPADLNAIYERITSLPAAVHKIVTRANEIADTIAIFKLLDRARTDGRRLIALAMGEAGLITRVLGPAWGSFLTYGSLAQGKESAAGQPSCEDLANLYRIRLVSRGTAITGIIGSPVGHSASPAMHNRAFAELAVDFVYLPFEVDELDEFFRRLARPSTREIDWNLRGLSVTIPHKSAVIRLLDEVDEVARKVGAVNTVVMNEDRLSGYNTDVRGAMEPLERACSLAGESCAVIGAGGAARAVIYGLLERGSQVSVFARKPDKARSLSESFGVTILSIESLSSSDARVIINTTPVGMCGHSEGLSPVPRETLRGRSIAYDLVYNPLETRFLADARAEGCRTISGLEMLVAQAALQFELWTGRKPPIDEMREEAIARIARHGQRL